MRKKKIILCVLTVLSCMLIAGAWGLKTTAASNAASVGKFSASDSRVVFRSEDIDYLNNQLEQLQNEMDDSVLDNATADVIVLDRADMRRGKLFSHGIINYDSGRVTADAADLFALADETDALGNAYATAICRALNEIGTYYDADGNVNHTAQTAQAIVLGCEQLEEGILQSQSVEHLSAAPVTEANITAGAAAWVDGQCIIGTGADNERAYQRGMEDGAAGNDDDMEIQYTYHIHTGNGQSGWGDGHVLYQSGNPGGCFRGGEHTHNEAGSYCEQKSVDKGEWYICQRSDWTYSAEQGGYVCAHGHFTPSVEPGQVCGNREWVANIVSYWDCNGDGEGTQGEWVNTWKIGCGKKARQKETATIIIRKNSGTSQ